MLKDKSGKKTQLRPGDVIIIDTDNESVSIIRDGEPLGTDKETATHDDGYWLLPRDGEQLDILAQLVADICGLSVEEIKDEEHPTYRFSC